MRFLSKKYYLLIGLLFLLMVGVALSTLYQHYGMGNVMVSSISSDGHYVISSDDKNIAVLWDLNSHSKKILSRNANMYSAYWIKNTPYYMWQDLTTHQVYVTDVMTGKIAQTLHLKFLIYGQAMSSDLKYYVASDSEWNIFATQGNYLKLLVAHYTGVPGFEGANKLINFTFSGNNTVLASGFGNANANDEADISGTLLFELNTFKPIHDYVGNVVQTFATISPDGKYVVAGDANGPNLFVWDLASGQQIYEGADLYFGVLNRHNSSNSKIWTWDKSKLIPIPPEFKNNNAGGTIQSIKFIDNEHYFVFYRNSHFGVFFSVKSPWPIKYLDLGKSPFPAVNYFERDQSMDTSPSTHTLVMAKETRTGIMVYHYDPTAQTLTKVWNGK